MMTLHGIRMGHRPQWRQKQKHCFTDEGEMRQKITEWWKCDNNVSLRFYHHTLMPPTPSFNSPFNTNFIFSHFAKVTTTARDVAIVLQGKEKKISLSPLTGYKNGRSHCGVIHWLTGAHTEASRLVSQSLMPWASCSIWNWKIPYLDVWVVLEVDNDWSLRAACVQTPAHWLASWLHLATKLLPH